MSNGQELSQIDVKKKAEYKHINRTGAYTKYYSLIKTGERLYQTIKEVE